MWDHAPAWYLLFYMYVVRARAPHPLLKGESAGRHRDAVVFEGGVSVRTARVRGVGGTKRGRSSEREAADSRRRHRARRPARHVSTLHAVGPLPAGEAVSLSSGARGHPIAGLRDVASGKAGGIRDGGIVRNPAEAAASPRPNNMVTAPSQRRVVPPWMGLGGGRLPLVVTLGLRFPHGVLFPSPRRASVLFGHRV